MGDVEECVPPANVHLDGPALSAIGRLSQVAKHLADALPGLADGEDRQALEKAIAMTDQIIGMLQAFNKTFGELERQAEKIIEILEEGEEATFCNQGSDEYYVSGVLAKRVRTIVVGLAGFATTVPEKYANLNLKENVVLLRGGRLKMKRSFLKVAC